MHDLRTSVYRHLQRLSLAFFTRTRTGEVQSRIANDIGGIENVVTSTATSVLSNVTTVLATVIAMLLLDWRLAAFALALLPLFVWLTKRVGEQRKKVTAERQASLADVSSIVQESLSVSGILLGKTMGRADDLAERFQTESERLAGLEVRSRMTGRWMMAAIQTTFAVMPALVYLFAGWTISRGSRRDHDRHARRVHDPPDAPVLPDREPPRRPARGAELARALRPDLRVPRPAASTSSRGRARSSGRAATSPSTRSGSATRPTPGRSRTSTSRFPRARRRRSSARPAPARRPAPTSSRGSTTPPGHGADRRDRRARADLPVPRRRQSGSSRRRRTSSTRRFARTSASRSRTRPTRRSRRRRAPRRSTS